MFFNLPPCTFTILPADRTLDWLGKAQPAMKHLAYLFISLILLLACQGGPTGEPGGQLSDLALVIEDSVVFQHPAHSPYRIGKFFWLHHHYYHLHLAPPATIDVYDSTGRYLHTFAQPDDPHNAPPFSPLLLFPGARPGQVGLLTGGVPHWVTYTDTVRTGQVMLADEQGQPQMEKYGIASTRCTGHYASAESLAIAPLRSFASEEYAAPWYEAPLAGLFRNGQLVRTLGSYPQVYRAKAFLGFLAEPLLAYDSVNKIVHLGTEAGTEVQSFTLSGKPVGQFGEPGRYLNNSVLSGLRTQTEVDQWMPSYYDRAARYVSLAHDPHSGRLYRLYVPGLGSLARGTIPNGAFGKTTYLQVYEKGQLVADLPLPKWLDWTVLRTGPGGSVYFKKKYFSRLEGSGQQLTVYRARLRPVPAPVPDPGPLNQIRF
jgi:hypothetical protein